MNKLSKLFIACLLMITLVGCGSGSDEGEKQTLKVFNWGEYMDTDLLKEFEEEYNCKVVYETFDSNEMMYTKLMGGNSYDVMVPSEYMIERLIKEDLLQPINYESITNLNVSEDILYQPFDPNNEYWVPYFCGNVGILYDTTVVDEADLKDGWELLRNTKYKDNLYMYDSERDSFAVALKALGYSMNSTNEKELDEAYNWLIDQREKMNPIYVGDESIDTMKSGEKAIAVMYSGDAAAVMAENEDMDFFMPEEGTNYWFDGFVISKDCKVSELANQFINFMISDENALLNAQAVGYYPTNLSAQKTAKEQDYDGINAFGIRIGNNDEIFNYQDANTKELYNSRWIKIISR